MAGERAFFFWSRSTSVPACALLLQTFGQARTLALRPARPESCIIVLDASKAAYKGVIAAALGFSINQLDGLPSRPQEVQNETDLEARIDVCCDGTLLLRHRRRS